MLQVKKLVFGFGFDKKKKFDKELQINKCVYVYSTLCQYECGLEVKIKIRLTFLLLKIKNKKSADWTTPPCIYEHCLKYLLIHNVN